MGFDAARFESARLEPRRNLLERPAVDGDVVTQRVTHRSELLNTLQEII